MTERSPQKQFKPRKAPSQSRSEETVASIVEAAAQVLENEGFEGFNTNAVARRAGVSIGSAMFEINTRSDAAQEYRGTFDN